MVLENDVYPTGYKRQSYTSQQAGYVPSNGGYQNCAPGMTGPGGYNTYPVPGPQNGYASGPSGAYGAYPQNHGHSHGHGPTPHGYGSNYGRPSTYGQQYPGAGYHSVKDVEDEE